MNTKVFSYLFLLVLSASSLNAQTALWRQMNNNIYNDNLSGNVGIGTLLPVEKLTVIGNASISGNIQTGPLQLGTWPANSGFVFFGAGDLDHSDGGNYALLQQRSNGGTYLNSPQDIRFRIGNSDKMILANNGNIGIGTTSPSEKLHVNGNTRISQALRVNSLLIGGKADNIDYPFEYETIGVNAANLNLRLQSPRGIYFHTGISSDEGANNETKTRLVILNNGRVGIGTTNPGSSLQVVGGIRARGGAPGSSGSSNNGYAFSGGSGDNDSGMFSTANGLVQFYTNSGERVRIDGSGNMGIGTTSPTQRLHVAGNALVDGSFQTGALKLGNWPASSAYVYFGAADLDHSNASNYALLQERSTGRTYLNSTETVRFRIDNADRMVIANNGNIGIGTTSPSGKLDINGDLYVRDDIFVTDDVVIESDLEVRDDIVVKDDVTVDGFMAIGRGLSGSASLTIENLREDNNGIRVKTSDAPNSSGSFFPSIRIENTANGGNALFIAKGGASKPGGGSWGTASDARVKKDVVNYKDGLEELRKVRPVWYTYNGKGETPEGERYVGIIAQELQKIADYMIIPGGNGYLGVDPSAFTYMLINAVQELDKENKNKDEKIEELATQNQALETRLAKLEAFVNALAADKVTSHSQVTETVINQTVTLSDVALLQNAPNPFDENTAIQYFIPQNVKKATLRISNTDGKLLKEVAITNRGQGQVTLEASGLSAGTYAYSLVLDGRVFDTKQMVLTH